VFNTQLSTALKGAGEAFVIGAVIGIGTVWGQPSDIQLTAAGLAAAGLVALKFGLTYFIAWLRTTAGIEKK